MVREVRRAQLGGAVVALFAFSCKSARHPLGPDTVAASQEAAVEYLLHEMDLPRATVVCIGVSKSEFDASTGPSDEPFGDPPAGPHPAVQCIWSARDVRLHNGAAKRRARCRPPSSRLAYAVS